MSPPPDLSLDLRHQEVNKRETEAGRERDRGREREKERQEERERGREIQRQRQRERKGETSIPLYRPLMPRYKRENEIEIDIM